jgi:hypothetical protein
MSKINLSILEFPYPELSKWVYYEAKMISLQEFVSKTKSIPDFDFQNFKTHLLFGSFFYDLLATGQWTLLNHFLKGFGSDIYTKRISVAWSILDALIYGILLDLLTKSSDFSGGFKLLREFLSEYPLSVNFGVNGSTPFSHFLGLYEDRIPSNVWLEISALFAKYGALVNPVPQRWILRSRKDKAKLVKIRLLLQYHLVKDICGFVTEYCQDPFCLFIPDEPQISSEKDLGRVHAHQELLENTLRFLGYEISETRKSGRKEKDNCSHDPIFLTRSHFLLYSANQTTAYRKSSKKRKFQSS